MKIATSYWFGATDDLKEYEWRWRIDNGLMSNWSTIEESAIGWFAGEPNSGTSYNCLLWEPAYGLYIDGYCPNSYYYICEHDRML